MFTREFVLDALERAVSTAAQSALLTIGAEQFNLLTVNPEVVLGFSLGGFVLSILKSLAARGVGSKDSASLVK